MSFVIKKKYINLKIYDNNKRYWKISFTFYHRFWDFEIIDVKIFQKSISQRFCPILITNHGYIKYGYYHNILYYLRNNLL